MSSQITHLVIQRKFNETIKHMVTLAKTPVFNLQVEILTLLGRSPMRFRDLKSRLRITDDNALDATLQTLRKNNQIYYTSKVGWSIGSSRKKSNKPR
jgi:hypothetical protein